MTGGDGSGLDAPEAPETLETDERILVSVIPPPWRWFVVLLLVTFAVSFLAYSFFALFREAMDVLTWIFIALFASFALEPAVDWLAKHGWRRGLATGLIMFGVFAASVLMVGLMIPMVIDQVQMLIEQSPDLLRKLSDFTMRWFNVDVSPEAIQQRLEEQLQQADAGLGDFAGDVAGNVYGFATSVVAGIFKLLTIGLFTFYLTADGPRFRRTICGVLPRKQQEAVLWTWELAIEKTGGYLYSRLLLAIASGSVTFIVLAILGVPFAVPLSIWMGLVSQFIPTIGTYIAMALPLLIALAYDPWTAVVLLVFFTAYQQVENYLLSPRITAKTMELHPAVAFGAAIVGAGIAGVAGAFLALPVVAIVQAIISSVVEHHAVVESNLTRLQDEEAGSEDEGEADAGPTGDEGDASRDDPGDGPGDG